jgi:multiple sugar transport system ATP-binding protein
MIAGLETVTQGTIRIGDRVVNSLTPSERNVAMAFERYGLYPHLTVFENIAYPLRLRHRPSNEILSRVAAVANQLRLVDVIDSRPADLSVGQQQRVSLARALVRRPTVFLLDEPLSHLELELREFMRSELKRLHQQVGHTTIYVTHDQSEALALADLVAVMNRGVLQQVGTPAAIFHHPANIFVAGFVGDPPTNFITFSVESTQDTVILRHETGFAMPLPAHYRAQAQAGRLPSSIVVGIRPPAIGVMPHGKTEERLPAEVVVAEPLGEVTLVTARVGEVVVRAETTTIEWRTGQVVHLQLAPAAVMLFDPQSTEAIQ